jgi:hypothetical protein
VLRCLDLLEQISMIALFDPKDIVQTVGVERLDMRSVGTQAIFGDDELEVGMILAQLGNKALGRVPFTIIFVCAIVLHNRFRHQRNDGSLIRMDNRGTQHLVIIGA